MATSPTERTAVACCVCVLKRELEALRRGSFQGKASPKYWRRTSPPANSLSFVKEVPSDLILSRSGEYCRNNECKSKTCDLLLPVSGAVGTTKYWHVNLFRSRVGLYVWRLVQIDCKMWQMYINFLFRAEFGHTHAHWWKLKILITFNHTS